MKKVLISSILVLVFSFLYAQDYLMSNGATINTCGGTFYDSGGSNGNYSLGENSSMTFCPNLPGQRVSLQFTSFDVDGTNNNVICFYDGVGTGGIAFGCNSNLDNLGLPFFVTSNDVSGCLTVTFNSVAAIATGTGWSALISCTSPCQPFQLQITPNVPCENNIINLCVGNSVQFTANGSYPNNDVYYHQSDASSVCMWYINSQLVHTGFSYNLSSINWAHATLRVVIWDVNNCFVEQNFTIYSEVYQHLIQAPANLTTYWVGQNISLAADSIIQTTTNETVSDSTPFFIPDGVGVSYERNIFVSNATSGNTIQSASDIQSVCLNMEHSYMGDLTITLICPNGNFVNLLEYSNNLGGSTHLGVPIDDDSNLNPGIGWNYCWAPNATFGDVNSHGGSTLPASPPDYNETGEGGHNFESLIGCPVNGIWTIQITDNLNSDNGYIFHVDLTFDTSVVAPDIYDTVTNCSWNGANIISSTNITATALATTPGVYTYAFFAMNSCGDTLIQYVTVNVIDTPAFVSGRVFIDENQDCIYNSSEMNQTNRIVEFSPGGYYASTDTNGFYMAAIPQGDYTVTLAASNYLSILCPAQQFYTVQVLRGDTVTGINFGDTLLPYNDMEVFLGASMAVLGTNFTLNILLSNHGNITNSGVLHLKTDSTFSFISCSGMGTCASAGNGKVNFNYSAIQPGGSLLLEAVFLVPVNTDIIGDILKSIAWFDTIPTDINLANNIDSIKNYIYAAYDPNVKTVMPVGEGQSGDIFTTDSILKYTIHFQNTGNWPATNVIITDTLSIFVDPATIEPGPSSHLYTFHLSGLGVAEFRFINIMLTDSFTNQNESNGYICYRIKQRNNNIGTEITNTANIYFDYNPLVATNTALNTVVEPLHVPVVSENKLQSLVHPNPVINNLNINFSSSDGENIVEISSVTGAFIASYHFNIVSIAEIPMKNLSNGVYIIRIISKNSTDVCRVVKM